MPVTIKTIVFQRCADESESFRAGNVSVNRLPIYVTATEAEAIVTDELTLHPEAEILAESDDVSLWAMIKKHAKNRILRSI